MTSIPLFIDEDTVSRLLSWDATFEAVGAAMKSVSKRRAFQNARTHTPGTSNCRLLTMPGFLDHDKFGVLACKLVTAAPNNASLEKPLPVINAHITLFDEKTGILKAIISATKITKWRTAAASAVATKYLLSQKSPKILAILGAGAQGESHALAFQHFFDFQEIRIWNHNKEKAENLVFCLNQLHPKNQIFKCSESNEECVRGADVIVTATFAKEPIVELEWLKEGVHINAVGAGLNHHSELAESIYLASHVYIDHLESAQVELSGLKKLGVEFEGEIGSVVEGDLTPSSVKHITVFQSLGMAVEDCAVARFIYDLYKKQQEKM